MAAGSQDRAAASRARLAARRSGIRSRAGHADVPAVDVPIDAHPGGRDAPPPQPASGRARGRRAARSRGRAPLPVRGDHGGADADSAPGSTETSTSARSCGPAATSSSSTSRANPPDRSANGEIGSPLRDVAGMLRSFDYATRTAMRWPWVQDLSSRRRARSPIGRRPGPTGSPPRTSITTSMSWATVRSWRRMRRPGGCCTRSCSTRPCTRSATSSTTAPTGSRCRCAASSICWTKAVTDDRRVLRELARLYDVQESYRNVHGERVHASVDSMIAVLGAMGAPIASLRDAPTALRARREELARRRIEPVIVAWGGQLREIEARLPASASSAPSVSGSRGGARSMARGDAGRDGCRGVGVRPGAHRDRPPAPRRTAHLVARRRGNDGAGARPVGPEEVPPALRPVVGRVRSALRAPCRGRLGCGQLLRPRRSAALGRGARRIGDGDPPAVRPVPRRVDARAEPVLTREPPVLERDLHRRHTGTRPRGIRCSA